VPKARPVNQDEHLPRLGFIFSDAITPRFLMQGQLRFLEDSGFRVFVLAPAGTYLNEIVDDENVVAVPIRIEREIRPLGDLKTLLSLVVALRKLRLSIVQASTPKAGLLGMVAGWLARVPVRVYTVRGLRLETLHGWRRFLGTLAERIAAGCAHRVVCVGPSLEEAYSRLGLAPDAKVSILAHGSSNGIDIDHFVAQSTGPEKNLQLRDKLGIDRHSQVIGFVGRLTRDKGIEDLSEAFFGPIRRRWESARLLLIGDFEEGDPISAATRQKLLEDDGVAITGFVSDPAPFYRLMNVLAFPSYREGLPNAPMEAAACEVPVVGYRATGTVDVVLDGETGALVDLGDRQGLAEALGRYLNDARLCARHGASARRRVADLFHRDLVWQAWLDFYRGLPTRAITSEEIHEPHVD
jgi:glycosyltransferase involved in cell wall biosynthesis